MVVAAVSSVRVGLLVTAFGFGFRHGFDWDHIAALTDITATQDSRRRSMVLATLYALGHAIVVLVLGLGAVVLGMDVPTWVDGAMERVVGATLTAFGAYVLVSLLVRRRDFRIRSRGAMVIGWVRRLRAGREVVVIEHEHEHSASEAHGHVHAHVHVGAGAATSERAHSHPHRHVGRVPEDPFAAYSRPTAFGLGVVHGIGGETPTQVLIFMTAAGVGGRGAGVALLVAFLVGLIASNTAVALAGTLGFVNATRSWAIYATLTVVTAAFSLAVGVLFLLGRTPALPSLFGG